MTRFATLGFLAPSRVAQEWPNKLLPDEVSGKTPCFLAISCTFLVFLLPDGGG